MGQRDTDSLESLRGVVRDALRHLYEPANLQHNRLVRMLRLETGAHPASRLRELLINAIEDLQTDQNLSQEQASRSHDILTYRYVHLVPQPEVADQFAVSTRQLRRFEQNALDVLSVGLIRTYQLQEQLCTETPHHSRPDDLSQFELASEEGTSTLCTVLEQVGQLLRPLAAQKQIDLHIAEIGETIPVAIPEVALRQILVNLVSVALQHAQETQVAIGLLRQDSEYLHLDVTIPISGRGLTQDDLTNLGATRHLLETYHSLLTLDGTSDHWARLSLKTATRRRVLLIDDNLDAAALCTKYLQRSAYDIYHAPDTEAGIALARTLHPQVIVIDVMNPLKKGHALAR